MSFTRGAFRRLLTACGTDTALRNVVRWGGDGAAHLGVLRIVVYMYWFDEQRHHVPHFHARFAGDEAVFDLVGNCLDGDLGPRATRLIREWCAERPSALQEAWNAAVAGKEIPWVAPLR